MHHKQCLLKRESTLQVAWIPCKFADFGAVVQLRNGGTWVDGWEIIKVGKARLSSEVEARCNDYKTQRDASDVDEIPNRVRTSLRGK